MFDPKDSVMDTTTDDIKNIKKELKALNPSGQKYARKLEEWANTKEAMLYAKTRCVVDVLRGLSIKDAQKVLNDANEKIVSVTVIPFDKK